MPTYNNNEIIQIDNDYPIQEGDESQYQHERHNHPEVPITAEINGEAI